jgi:hypothetical protein
VNLKIDVQRVGLDLCKGGLGTANWARVAWFGHEQRILKTHVLSSVGRFKGSVQWGAHCFGASIVINLQSQTKILLEIQRYETTHYPSGLSTGSNETV